MKSKKLWLGIGAVVLIVLCMGVAFLATQGKTDCSFSHYANQYRLLYADR